MSLRSAWRSGQVSIRGQREELHLVLRWNVVLYQN